MDRLGLSISEEKLKKGIEEDGADGYEDEDDQRLLSDSESDSLIVSFLPRDALLCIARY